MGWLSFAIDSARRFGKLAEGERSLLIQALVLLPVTNAALHLVGLGRWQSFLARWAPLPKSGRARSRVSQVRRVSSTSRMVRLAARRGLYPASCLRSSLTLWWLLRRQGIDSALRLGVRKQGEGIEAHAWVEYEGNAVDGSESVLEHFVSFPEPILPLKVGKSV
jgi:hypothetical protein